MRDLEPCQLCGEMHDPEELIEFGEMRVCGECLDTSTICCDRCGSRMWRSENAGDNDTYLCRSCYENYYVHCDACDSLIRTDDAHYEAGAAPLCYDCYCQRVNRYTIQPYGYKPVPIFYGDGERFMGIELEIDEGGESDANARMLMEIANCGEERVYIKHDGSLDDGMEIVTHPMTLDYHLNHMPWAEMLEKARELGYRSHQARTCGLHIHVGRDCLGDTTKEQDEVIARILYFFEKHWDELLKASRRTIRQLEQWANRYGYQEEPRRILDTAKKSFSGVRYTAVNLTNAATVEFRWMRGTLRHSSLVAALQLVNRIVDCAICLSDEEMKQMSWTTFVAGCTQWPELIQYFKERRIFVNDPVESEAEV